jgi:hypothetical protein
LSNMASPSAPSIRLVHAGQLRQLAGSSGLCVTALLPPFVPGEETRESAAALLRDYARQAEASLTRLGAGPAHIGPLLEPLRKLAADPAITEGSHWSRAIFRSPEVFEEFLLRRPVDGSVTVSDRFDLLPLVAEAELPAEFYLLKLSKKRAVVERAGLRLEPVRLPGTAQTLEEFLALDTPDHDRENRMTAGGSRQIRFGTGHEQEAQQAHLGDFYKHVDHALAAWLGPKNEMVVLVGVEEDTALYRARSAHPDLIADSIERSPDDGALDSGLLRLGFDLIRKSILRRNAAARESAREKLAPARFIEDAEAIAGAAASGRVERLYLAENEHQPRLNRALIDTLLHSGEPHAIPIGAAAGAVLRY